MNLVFLCNEYPPYTHGGIGSLIQTLARKLVACGWSVHVVGVYKDETGSIENDHGVQVHRIPADARRGLPAIMNALRVQKKLEEIHKQNPIDIVEGSELSFGFLKRSTPWIKVIRMSGGHTFFPKHSGEMFHFGVINLKRHLFQKLITSVQ